MKFKFLIFLSVFFLSIGACFGENPDNSPHPAPVPAPTGVQVPYILGNCITADQQVCEDATVYTLETTLEYRNNSNIDRARTKEKNACAQGCIFFKLAA